jgi:peptide/nickel transport system permease protein
MSLKKSELPRSSKIWWKFRSRSTTLIGLLILVILYLSCWGAPLLTRYDPVEFNLTDRIQPPSREHLMGTDRYGRDIFSRILYGGRLSMNVGIIAVLLAAAMGVPLGILAGYYGKWTDRVISRYADILLAFPGFLLALTIVFALGPSLPNVMLAVGLSTSPTYIRLVRGTVLQLRQSQFIEAATMIGCTNIRIILRHILPNALSPILIFSALSLAGAILSAAGLSFLGAGVQPPTPEWGALLNEGRFFIQTGWWLTTFPGLAIMLAVLSINLIGDGLRDALDPTTRAMVG